MSASILFFGSDTCHRLPVLAAAGFEVEHCPSIAQLSATLSAGPESRPAPQAVLLCDHDGRLPQDAITLARTHPAISLVLFRETNCLWNEADFDLVIPVLTPPPSWLHDLGALLKNPLHSGPRLVSPQLVPSPPGPLSAQPAPFPGPSPASVPAPGRSTRSA